MQSNCIFPGRYAPITYYEWLHNYIIIIYNFCFTLTFIYRGGVGEFSHFLWLVIQALVQL